MNVVEFPECCTGSIIVRLGKASCTSYDNRDNYSVQEIKDYILAAANPRQGEAFISASTNNTQKEANQALRELGFKHSTWMSKKQHRNTQVRLWWAHIPTLLKENT